tara:strand:- start:301 stop:588 length:288 start_codon:yes stop_codon:yes gene_type:complete
MLNSPIDTSEKDAAIERKWHELEATGQVIFVSDDEIRIICKDEIMFEVLEELGSDHLFYDITVAVFSFALKVTKLFEAALNEAMEEAIEDFYNES